MSDSPAEEQMKEVLARISPASTSIILVHQHEHGGYELFSRYDNRNTALVLLEAAMKLMTQGEHREIDASETIEP